VYGWLWRTVKEVDSDPGTGVRSEPADWHGIGSGLCGTMGSVVEWVGRRAARWGSVD